MNYALPAYHRMPAPMRSLAGSLRGYYLRSWRYGPETERLVEEALERESWSGAQWQAWYEPRLSYVLYRAATKVPYYRQQWRERWQRGERVSWEVLGNWPVLEKEQLRKNPKAFVADDCNIRNMFADHTSGTTGTSLSLWLNRTTVRNWYALFEARCRRWYGVSRHDRWAILGGQLITPVARRRPPFWIWNAGLKQLYLSSYHLAPDLIGTYLEALRHYRITYLLGYTSSLYALAQEALRLKLRDLQMAVAITNAEPLFTYQRDVIAEAFHCPVRETYGMAELVGAASECPAGGLHLWPEVGMIEILAGESQVINGEAGDLVCTGLLNADMPLIRYRVGDRGALSSNSSISKSSCACGRTLPLMGPVEGRIDDSLFTVDGRRVGRLDPAFKGHLPVREAQIIQEALDQIRVRYVPASDFSSASAGSLIREVRARMGKVKVVLEPVDAVPREANGKFRGVVCRLPADERTRLEQNAG